MSSFVIRSAARSLTARIALSCIALAVLSACNRGARANRRMLPSEPVGIDLGARRLGTQSALRSTRQRRPDARVHRARSLDRPGPDTQPERSGRRSRRAVECAATGGRRGSGGSRTCSHHGGSAARSAPSAAPAPAANVAPAGNNRRRPPARRKSSTTPPRPPPSALKLPNRTTRSIAPAASCASPVLASASSAPAKARPRAHRTRPALAPASRSSARASAC